MKLLHNYVSLGTATLLAEAVACARLSGVNAQTFVDVLAMGGWGAALKDLSYYNQMAIDPHADHTVTQAVKNTLETACQQGYPQALVSALVELLVKRQRPDH